MAQVERRASALTAARRSSARTATPGVEIARLWSTDGRDALDRSGAEPDPSARAFYPPPGGTRFLKITFPPGFGASDPDDDASRFARLLMHRTVAVFVLVGYPS